MSCDVFCIITKKKKKSTTYNFLVEELKIVIMKLLRTKVEGRKSSPAPLYALSLHVATPNDLLT